ncbi:hypothetical protein M513_06458 [Trichuris suis]|uniref:Uncharacterized protein n=1 Tax=Trichuris suis TaxID=68888 RepID=A0A085M5W5_9BILA|nr:hypothetical protein M513_06458 [Trichuris suis]
MTAFLDVFLDCFTKQMEQICIIFTRDGGSMLHVIDKKNSFCIPEDRCHNLPQPGFNARLYRSWRISVIPLPGLLLRFVVVVTEPQNRLLRAPKNLLIFQTNPKSPSNVLREVLSQKVKEFWAPNVQ